MCGTGVQVAAVTKIEHRAVGTSEMGPITPGKSAICSATWCTGALPKYRDWLTPVYVPEHVG
ncbi:MAG: hypothetical protein U0521_28210 [Anaerolineae bacterium]